ncbi:hypothetical protein CIPAW_15G158400 [Carya illinoinensis]|uniref:Uncharacterized protein n=1 Tax=Carya illinoinensis TaxID=32201 RepID=A0A8T1ND83_CARIL|nr:hypothetical protein CIPAW_15G158400 [Carya illinoinensis]
MPDFFCKSDGCTGAFVNKDGCLLWLMKTTIPMPTIAIVASITITRTLGIEPSSQLPIGFSHSSKFTTIDRTNHHCLNVFKHIYLCIYAHVGFRHCLVFSSLDA